MDAAVLRRYLQPSPTLRWHPWAPIVAGLLSLGFAFWLGATWGFSAVAHYMNPMRWEASRERIRLELETSRPAQAVVWEARHFDAVVVNWVKEEPLRASPLRQLRDFAERWMFWRGADIDRHRVDTVRSYAEYRVANLSGDAPRWQRTATFCDEGPQPASGRDLRAEYEPVAQAYSKMLGRPIPAEQLAPAVPNARCEWKGVKP